MVDGNAPSQASEVAHDLEQQTTSHRTESETRQNHKFFRLAHLLHIECAIYGCVRIVWGKSILAQVQGSPVKSLGVPIAPKFLLPFSCMQKVFSKNCCNVNESSSRCTCVSWLPHSTCGRTEIACCMRVSATANICACNCILLVQFSSFFLFIV